MNSVFAGPCNQTSSYPQPTAPAVERQRDTPSQVEVLSKLTMRLGESTKKLAARLSPLLRPVPQTGSAENQKEGYVMCDHAMRLLEIGQQIDRIADALDFLESAVEI